MNFRFSSLFLTAAVAASILAVAGCGGGGSEVSSPDAAIAEGLWKGTTSDGYDLGLVVLETGEYWGVLATGGSAFGMMQGNANSSGGDFSSANGLTFAFGSGSATAFTVAGKYVAKTSLTGTVTSNRIGTFNTTADARYDTPVTLAAIAGNWTGTAGSLTQTSAFTMEVTSNGAFTFTGGTGCIVTGAFVPRPTGKSVYNVNAMTDLATCGAANTISGIAIPSADGGSLSIAVIRPDRTNSLLAIATKS